MKKLTILTTLYEKPTSLIKPTLDVLENIQDENIEVILIYNDFGKFKYTDFLKIQNYKNIKIIKTKNHDIKKHGKIIESLSHINGEYVQIFEPDDSIIVPNLIRFVKDLTKEKQNPDLIVTNIWRWLRVKNSYNPEFEQVSKDGETSEFLERKISWNATTIFKTDILKKLYNQYGAIIMENENIILADPIRSIASFNFSKKIYYYSGCYYYYAGNSTSADVNRNNEIELNNELLEFGKLLKIVKDNEKIYLRTWFYREQLLNWYFKVIRTRIELFGWKNIYKNLKEVNKILVDSGISKKLIAILKREIWYKTSLLKFRKIKIKNPEQVKNEEQSLKEFSSYHNSLKKHAPLLFKDLIDQGFKPIAHSGTILAIARNSGFIPWDDDIDIYLDYKHLKKNFELFNKTLEKNGYEFVDFINDKGFVDWNVFKIKRDMNVEHVTSDGIKFDAVSFIDIMPIHPVQCDKLYKRISELTKLYIQPNMSFFFFDLRRIWFKSRPSHSKNFQLLMQKIIFGWNIQKIILSKRKNEVLNLMNKIDGDWENLMRFDKFWKRKDVQNMEQLEIINFEGIEMYVPWNFEEYVEKSFGKNWKYQFLKDVPHEPKWLNRKYAIHQGYLLKYNKSKNKLERIKKLA